MHDEVHRTSAPTVLWNPTYAPPAPVNMRPERDDRSAAACVDGADPRRGIGRRLGTPRLAVAGYSLCVTSAMAMSQAVRPGSLSQDSLSARGNVSVNRSTDPIEAETAERENPAPRGKPGGVCGKCTAVRAPRTWLTSQVGGRSWLRGQAAGMHGGRLLIGAATSGCLRRLSAGRAVLPRGSWGRG